MLEKNGVMTMESAVHIVQRISTGRHRARWGDALACLLPAALLCTVFAVDPAAWQGVVTGKVALLHRITSCGVLVAAAAMGLKRAPDRPAVRLLSVDAVIGGLAVLLLATYRWRLNAEPVKLLFAGQWLVWWWLLRPFAAGRRFRRFAVYALAVAGLAEVGTGLCQLFGLVPPQHTRYPLTGTFYNPGPFAGFLAMALPVVLGRMLHLGRLRHVRLIRRPVRLATARRLLQAVCWLTVAVLPATMSRIAWMAAAVSCALVWMAECPDAVQRTRCFLRRKPMGLLFRKGRRAAGWVVLCLCLVLAAGGLYFLKADSANGRFWMGYVSLRVMARHPLGTGLGGFPAAYAEAQAACFAVHDASPAVQRMAGDPAYAFNEYLQCGVELGWAGLLLMAAGLILTIRNGWKHGRYGWSGALVALAVFAAASYPLQLPSFWVLLAIAGNMAVADRRAVSGKDAGWRKAPARRTVYVLLLLLSATCTVLQQGTQQAYRDWMQTLRTYASGDPEAAGAFQALYGRLCHEPQYLFEYAKSLNAKKDYAGADRLLERAAMLSSDPMIWNVRGRNAWEQGRYEKAEQLLLRAFRMVPSRMYPCYLLARLYADPAFFNRPEMERFARKVLEMNPRVVSPATRDMQQEMDALLQRFAVP